MECLHSVPCEVNCAGLTLLRAVPCYGGGGSVSVNLGRYDMPIVSPWHTCKELKDRLVELGKHRRVAGGHLVYYGYRHGGGLTYYFEVTSVWRKVRLPGGWTDMIIMLQVPVCYYIGSYPFYWNIDNKCPVVPHNTMTEHVEALGAQPSVYGVYFSDLEMRQLADIRAAVPLDALMNYLSPEGVKFTPGSPQEQAQQEANKKIEELGEDLLFLQTKQAIQEYIMKDEAINSSKKWWDDCLEQYKPKKPTEEHHSPKEPGRPPPPPEKEIKELTLPAPQKSLTITPAPGVELYELKMTYSENPKGPPTKLNLMLYLDEKG